MSAVLLDRRTGRPETLRELLGPSGEPISIERNREAGWVDRPLGDEFASKHEYDQALISSVDGKIPQGVLDLLEKSRAAGQLQPKNSGNFYVQPLYWIIAAGTQILNTTTETIMVPSFTLPAGYLQPNSTLRYTVYGEVSFNATPGTLTVKLKYNGVGGTSLAASGAYAPGGGGLTTRSSMVQYLLTCYTIGTAGTVLVMGYWTPPQFDNTSATTLQGNLQMLNIPVSGAATTSVNTTTANTLDPTALFSVGTATTQWTSHLALLESVV